MPFTFKLSKRLARLKAAVFATRLPAHSLAAQAPTRPIVPQIAMSRSSAAVTVRSLGTGHAGRAVSRSRVA